MRTSEAEKLTTRELLVELTWRMAHTQNSTAGDKLGRDCDEATENLDRGVLDYRRPEQTEGNAAWSQKSMRGIDQVLGKPTGEEIKRAAEGERVSDLGSDTREG